jgi:hypothetical protein
VTNIGHPGTSIGKKPKGSFLNSLPSKCHFATATVNRERRFRALVLKKHSPFRAFWFPKRHFSNLVNAWTSVIFSQRVSTRQIRHNVRFKKYYVRLARKESNQFSRRCLRDNLLNILLK